MELPYIFLDEVKEYFAGRSNRVRHATTLSNHAIRLHKQRLNRCGYQIQYEVEHRTDQQQYESDFCSDSLYKTSYSAFPIYLTTSYIQNGQVVHSTREDKKFATYVEDLAEGRTTLNEDEAINCPNCGAAGKVNDFRNGCSNCGTHFEMSDVYPSVGAYTFMDNFSLVGRDTSTLSNKIGVAKDAYKNLFKLLTKVPTLVSAAKTISIFGTAKEYQEFIRQYRPDFSYVHFLNAVISMMSMMLYADSPQQLPFNKMAGSYVVAPDLIDFTIEGFGLNKGDHSIDGNIASVNVTLFINGLYNVNGRIKKSNDKFQATFVRDITKPISQGFSLTRINCPSCGGVFDAMNGKFCPYCGNEYNLANEEWVIVDMRRI